MQIELGIQEESLALPDEAFIPSNGRGEKLRVVESEQDRAATSEILKRRADLHYLISCHLAEIKRLGTELERIDALFPED